MRDTIELARDAGLIYRLSNSTFTDGRWWMDAGEPSDELKAFEALVRADERNKVWSQKHWTEYEQAIAAAEREACAKVCDEYSATGKIEEFDRGWLACAKNVAAAIRARGETK